MSAAGVLGIVGAALAVLLIAVAALALRLTTALRAARTRIDELETTVVRLESERSDGRALRVARRTAKAVVGTAERFREGGVEALLGASLEELSRFVTDDRTEIARIAAPDGTVTVLFSDIVGSTARNERLGDRGWLRLLRVHDALVRREVAACHGHVVKTQGDGFMVVFPDPVAGVRAAVGIRRALASSGRLRAVDIRVRIGLHTGRVLTRDGDYFGRNVALAARVAAYAEADEILVTDPVRDAVGESFALELVATTELKGLAGEHRLWAV
ncbi:adenylate/guanylate cyclase domain-containing protein [Nocardioides sp.]|jgi:class 3 adenylate cyclase|uniref:adenylate/guanylate cyclase domain-containing protein n=1 Tax=Nocardioides sp. TaxID=35761 RepID=UPI002C4F59BF|nr:adenylate/guanylate cyclase domain-containing protein [Nocardioides sp.]HVX55281.1 adenylate/guanylate cyclase domain-containing protein [Nocardioides sp.]